MPYTYRVSPEERLVYISGEGDVELSESKETLLSIAAFLSEHFPECPGMAIVVSGPAHYRLATTASVDIEGRGLHAGAFEDAVAAAGWLKSFINPIGSS